ncbi:unnamed protein product [Phytophthora lilii]|uniref:Unnamed protein product n=1 Tax=Phytophthora lilii TaxID=2077276 RepID=A0A9W6U1G8_9STRA|nr:unnamed protein product [Phytophthora lilii]
MPTQPLLKMSSWVLECLGHAQAIQEPICAIEIAMDSNDYLNVGVLKLPKFRLELVDPAVAAAVVANLAERDNNVQYLLREYSGRLQQSGSQVSIR